MSVSYTCAIRASFFDITHTVDNPLKLPEAARYLEDGLLLLDEGTLSRSQNGIRAGSCYGRARTSSIFAAG